MSTYIIKGTPESKIVAEIVCDLFEVDIYNDIKNNIDLKNEYTNLLVDKYFSSHQYHIFNKDRYLLINTKRYDDSTMEKVWDFSVASELFVFMNIDELPSSLNMYIYKFKTKLGRI